MSSDSSSAQRAPEERLRVVICHGGDDRAVALRLGAALDRAARAEGLVLDCSIGSFDAAGASREGAPLDAVVVIVPSAVADLRALARLAAASDRDRLIALRLAELPLADEVADALGRAHWIDAFAGPIERYVLLLLDLVRGRDQAQGSAMAGAPAAPEAYDPRVLRESRPADPGPRSSIRDRLLSMEGMDGGDPPTQGRPSRRLDDITAASAAPDDDAADSTDLRAAVPMAAGAAAAVLPPSLAAALVARRRRPEPPAPSLPPRSFGRRASSPAPRAAEAAPQGSAPLWRWLLLAAVAAGAVAAGAWFGIKLFGLVGMTAAARRGADRGDGAASPVDCSVFAPGEIARDGAIIVQVFVHAPEVDEAVAAAAAAADDEASRRGFASLPLDVPIGARIALGLAVPGLDVVETEAVELVWRGRTQSAQFLVRARADAGLGRTVATVRAAVDGVPAGLVRFVIEVKASARAEPAPQGEAARRYSKAYICYATADRAEVLKRVQMLHRVGIDYFQDVLDLAPGQRWEAALYRHIDGSDLFLLFWSSNAKNSHWVHKEVLYALERQARSPEREPEIVPVLLEGPPPVPPPPELAHLHFNDPILYFMADSGARLAPASR